MTELIELIERLEKSLTESNTQNQSLIERNESLMKTQLELETQSQLVSGQLNDVKTYQTGLMEQNKELQTANQKLQESITALQKEQDQPQALSTTSTNEPFLSEKDELIERLEKQVASLTDRNSEMFKEVMMLRTQLRR